MKSNGSIVVIAHGKSEMILIKDLSFLLNMDTPVHMRDNGREAIVISHLPKLLMEDPMTSESALAKAFPQLRAAHGKVTGLKVFPIMDYDGDDRNALSYVTGNLLRDVPLSKAVVPILNYPNLDAVMESMGYGSVDEHRKPDFYHDFARSMKGGEGIIKELKHFYERLCNCKNTNMEIVLYEMMIRNPSFQDQGIVEPGQKSWDMLRK